MSADSSTSVCNIFKDNTSKVIKKLEIQIPSHFQIYSDMYKEYLHVVDVFLEHVFYPKKNFLTK
jgi:hypothetical protein